MDYAAAAAAAAPATDPHHAHYPHPYAAYPYPYDAYHQPASATDPPTVAASLSSSSYYPVPAAAPAAAAPQYDPYAAYQYYGPPAIAAASGGAGGASLAGYYFTAGEASHQAAATPPTQAAPAATGKDAGKHFGFDPQRYVQAAAARASNGTATPAAAPGMHHAQWNAHFGHPVPKNVLRKQYTKKKPKVVQPATCEICKIQCDTLEVLMIHKQGKRHKKNMEKLQDSITPKPIKPPSNIIGPSMPPAAVVNWAVPDVQPKKKKSSPAATAEDLEVKKRRVLEAGAAQGEVKICTVCNVVVNSQKVYEFHIAGQKHQAMVQKQHALQFVNSQKV